MIVDFAMYSMPGTEFYAHSTGVFFVFHCGHNYEKRLCNEFASSCTTEQQPQYWAHVDPVLADVGSPTAFTSKALWHPTKGGDDCSHL
jgi:hypothetical protein